MTTSGGRAAPSLRGDVFGGLTAAVIALPLALAFGVAAFAPLGPAHAATGALVGLLGAIFTGFFAALFGGTPPQVTGPTAPMTVVLTTFLAETVQAHGPGSISTALVMAAATIVLGGAVQIGIGVAGGGKVVKYFPYPVIAGFMNGIAILIFLGQLEPFFGLDDGWADFDLATAWVPITVGCATIASILVTRRLSKAVPASLVGLLVGVGAYVGLGLAGFAPLRIDDNDLVVGAIPNPFASLDGLMALLPVLHTDALAAAGAADIQRIAVTAGTLGVLGSIDSLLTSVVADQMTGERHDARRELVGQGIGNIVSGMLGGLAGAGATVRTLVNLDAGGRTRRSGMIHSAGILVVVLLLGTPAGWIPKAALAGILFVTAVGMLDQYSLGLVRKSLVRHELAVIVLVAAVTVVVDLMIAVGAGLAVAGALFVWEQARQPVVRRRFRGDELFSRRVRRTEELELLEQHGGRTLIYELSGSLFFGTTDQLLTEVEADAPAADRFIFDFSKVEDMDLSGVRVMLSVFTRLAAQGATLAVSGLADLERRSPRVQRVIEQLGIMEPIAEERRHSSLDLALEGFEQELLGQHMPRTSQDVALPLSECTGFAELTEPERNAIVEAAGERRTAEAGEVLARSGAPADALWLIRAGRVSVRSGPNARRLTSLGSGALWGVHALLDEASWPTSLRADTRVECLRIDRAALEALREREPDAVQHLERAILRSAMHRLDRVTQELALLEET